MRFGQHSRRWRGGSATCSHNALRTTKGSNRARRATSASEGVSPDCGMRSSNPGSAVSHTRSRPSDVQDHIDVRGPTLRLPPLGGCGDDLYGLREPDTS